MRGGDLGDLAEPSRDQEGSVPAPETAGREHVGSVTLSELEAHLWESANILRGPVDQADYKSYVFPLLFLKRISDVYDEVGPHAVAAWAAVNDVAPAARGGEVPSRAAAERGPTGAAVEPIASKAAEETVAAGATEQAVATLTAEADLVAGVDDA